MRLSLRTMRLASILLPAALVLHEAAYALAGGGLIGAHGYLDLAVPLVAALGASLAFPAVLLAAVGVGEEGAERWAPFAIASALAAIFCVQELAEAVLLGGGWSGLGASVAISWLVPPLALLLGALASAMVVSLARAGEILAEVVTRHRPSTAPVGAVWRPSRSPFLPAAACAGLSFGAARRPPPARD